MSKSKELLESIVDRKPSETAEIFDEALTEKIKEKITAYADVVAENFFDVEAEEDSDEAPEENSDQIDELSSNTYFSAYDKNNRKNVDPMWAGNKKATDAEYEHQKKRSEKFFNKGMDQWRKEMGRKEKKNNG